MEVNKWDVLKSIRTIMLFGGMLYLGILGISMALGPFTWHPDNLGQHGEPYLVLAFAGYIGYEFVISLKRLG